MRLMGWLQSPEQAEWQIGGAADEHKLNASGLHRFMSRRYINIYCSGPMSF